MPGSYYAYICFEQWDYGLVNEENSENPNRVLDHGKDVLSPSDVGVWNARDIAAVLFAIYRGQSDLTGEDIDNAFPDMVETAITQTDGMSKTLSAFCRLTYAHKMDYLAETFAHLAADELFTKEEAHNCDFGVNGYDIAGNLLSYKERMGYEYRPVTTLPFDLAQTT